jgi:isoquinoline 1-oxidoreductase subunit alpha
MATTIKINGVDRTVDVDGDTPLLWVLRDVLGMTGTKFGCGMALCGACTVHVDGAATRSCITSIDSIGGSAITTIEAIGATAAGAKIQKAWLDREVVQCGYCQSGQIMSASALLAATRIRRIPISTTRCPATSVAAGPMSAFARRSSRPRNRPDRGADNDPRSPHPAQLAAGRSGRGRRPAA